MMERTPKGPSRDRLKSIRRKAVSLAEEVVRTRLFQETSLLPLVIEPAVDDLDLIVWARENRDLIELKLLEHGGLLFRGFDLSTVEAFHAFAGTVCSELVNYFEGSSPRLGVGDKVYTSTEYPAELFVSLHNEMSYAHKWPRKILFYCLTPPAEGGETPIADSRRVYERVDPAVRDRFVSKGLRYRRNLHGDRGAGLAWQTVFETADRAAVESYCRDGGIEFRWKPDGGLWTSQLRPAAVAHPKTGEMVWFNQVHQFHPSNLGKESWEALMTTITEEELPINASYGDDTPLEIDALAAVRAAYDEVMVRFPWQRGDVLLLDNMLVAHGRMPFKGPRKIVVAMGETTGLHEVSTTPPSLASAGGQG